MNGVITMPLSAELKLVLCCLLFPVPAKGAPLFWNSCTENFAGGERLPFPYCNSTLSTSERVADLISRLTPEEKCAALDTGNPQIDRLGIPSLPGGEALHGVVSDCGEVGGDDSTGCPSSFPAPIGLGAAFDEQLYASIGTAIGTEARALNNQAGKAGLYLFAPNINPVRDPYVSSRLSLTISALPSLRSPDFVTVTHAPPSTLTHAPPSPRSLT